MANGMLTCKKALLFCVLMANANAFSMEPVDLPPQKSKLKTIAQKLIPRFVLNAQLIAAAKKGDAAAVKDLLERDANPNVKSIRPGIAPFSTDGDFVNSHASPLHHAAFSGRTEVCKLLIDARANVDAQDEIEKVPLHYAAQWGNVKICEMLVSAGADINAADKIGQTALIYASYENQTEIAELLLKSGANPNSKRTIPALAIAGWKGNVEIIQLLLEYNASVSYPDTLELATEFIAHNWSDAKKWLCLDILIKHMLKLPSDVLRKRIITFLLSAKNNPFPKDICALIAKQIVEIELAENSKLSYAYQEIQKLPDHRRKQDLLSKYFPGL